MQYHIDFHKKVMIQSGSQREHLISSNAFYFNKLEAFFIVSNHQVHIKSIKNLVTHLVTQKNDQSNLLWSYFIFYPRTKARHKRLNLCSPDWIRTNDYFLKKTI